jgi:hypothetical protein
MNVFLTAMQIQVVPVAPKTLGNTLLVAESADIQPRADHLHNGLGNVITVVMQLLRQYADGMTAISALVARDQYDERFLLSSYDVSTDKPMADHRIVFPAVGTSFWTATLEQQMNTLPIGFFYLKFVPTQGRL